METMKEADLKDIYQKYSGEKAGIFFDRKNIFVFSSDDLSGLFKRSLRRVEDASVKRDFPSSLSVVVKEYSPLGIACENFMPESGSKCFYFNENGVIFDVSPAIISELFVFVKDKNLNIGNFPFQKYSKEQVDFILAFKRYLLEESGALVDHFEFKDQFKDIEVFLRSGARIFLTEDQSPKDQARATAEILKNKIKGDLSSLDYIDLRIKNKAYYKLKQNAGYKTGTSTEPDLQ
ncbi:FtsQ-type POTRA domain-containing protein [Candidatus Azambacteria bacterium]|nr:FtsQ-type POTRA domain-containing protein [Candidatus Azambacteria bacterium]